MTTLKMLKAGDRFQRADCITGEVTNQTVYTATHNAQAARARNYVVVLVEGGQLSGHKDNRVVIVKTAN